MKSKTLILSMLCIFLSIAQLKAQKTPDLQLDYPWTNPKLDLQKDSYLFFKPPLADLQAQRKHPGQRGKTYERWPMPIASPNLSQLVEMPIAKMDTSIHFYLRIKDLEALKEEDKQN